MVFSGRYLDRFECEGSNWKFKFRRVVMDWSRRRDVVDERAEGSFAALTKGLNNQQDASWHHLASGRWRWSSNQPLKVVQDQTSWI